MNRVSTGVHQNSLSTRSGKDTGHFIPGQVECSGGKGPPIPSATILLNEHLVQRCDVAKLNREH